MLKEAVWHTSRVTLSEYRNQVNFSLPKSKMLAAALSSTHLKFNLRNFSPKQKQGRVIWNTLQINLRKNLNSGFWEVIRNALIHVPSTFSASFGDTFSRQDNQVLILILFIGGDEGNNRLIQKQMAWS